VTDPKLDKYILAVDPGELTGICLIHIGTLEKIYSDELPSWQEVARMVDSTLREHAGNIDVVCERFTITQQTAKNSQQTLPLELIGIIKFLTWVHTGQQVTLQSPADAKRFGPNPRLKAVGLWHTGGEGHALDALRHALLRAVKLGWKDPKLLF
jgi:hypothetical protein